MIDRINPLGIDLINGTARQVERIKENSFKDVLEGVKFSKHASCRSVERNIQIDEKDLGRLGDACERAEQKGIRDALIVMENSAFIVNTLNRVVVTVVDKNEMQSNVFTNIDGAIFI